MSKATVAILGASADRAKFGNKSVRAHLKAGYEVYPVNPSGGEIEGLPAYRTLADVPIENLDRISVYLRPQVGFDASGRDGGKDGQDRQRRNLVQPRQRIAGPAGASSRAGA